MAQRMICPHSAYCVNNPGGYECICPGDTQLIDGECIQRKYIILCVHARFRKILATVLIIKFSKIALSMRPLYIYISKWYHGTYFKSPDISGSVVMTVTFIIMTFTFYFYLYYVLYLSDQFV